MRNAGSISQDFEQFLRKVYSDCKSVLANVVSLAETVWETVSGTQEIKKRAYARFFISGLSDLPQRHISLAEQDCSSEFCREGLFVRG